MQQTYSCAAPPEMKNTPYTHKHLIIQPWSRAITCSLMLGELSGSYLMLMAIQSRDGRNRLRNNFHFMLLRTKIMSGKHAVPLPMKYFDINLQLFKK